MAVKIRGNQDGENGRNESYTIHGRGVVSRVDLVKEVEQGLHPGHSVYEINGEKYVRSNRDDTETNNVNKDRQ